MLILTRKEGEATFVDVGDIRITFIYIGKNGSNSIKIGVDAPKECTILREEVDRRQRMENLQNE